MFRSALRKLGISGGCWPIEAVCTNSLPPGFPTSNCLVWVLLVCGVGFAVFEVGRATLGFNGLVGVDFGRFLTKFDAVFFSACLFLYSLAFGAASWSLSAPDHWGWQLGGGDYVD